MKSRLSAAVSAFVFIPLPLAAETVSCRISYGQSKPQAPWGF